MGSVQVRKEAACLLLAFSLSTGAALAQTSKDTSAVASSDERRTAHQFEIARQNPNDLQEFLRRMPKGTDLHNHLSGAVYAESFIRAAVEDRLCVDIARLSFAKPSQTTAPGDSAQPNCATGAVPAAQAYQDQHLYDSLVDAFSMRGFVPTPGITGHDQFFNTFARFGGTTLATRVNGSMKSPLARLRRMNSISS